MADKAASSGSFAAAEAASGAREALTRRWRVLVIDDEPAIGRLIRNLLPQHEIDVVGSAELGLARLRGDDAFDVVVCDVMMPDLSGMDVYDVLCEEKQHELARRFVFITGGAFTERASTFLARVPNRRLDKPFAIGDLELAMAETIAEEPRRVR